MLLVQTISAEGRAQRQAQIDAMHRNKEARQHRGKGSSFVITKHNNGSNKLRGNVNNAKKGKLGSVYNNEN